jgi:hypothetical protein
MVTGVPATPLVALRLVMVGLATVKLTVLDCNPFCSTCTVPDCAVDATVATTWMSLQLFTTPGAVPRFTTPLPWVALNPVPVIVTCVMPATPDGGETVMMLGGGTVTTCANVDEVLELSLPSPP